MISGYQGLARFVITSKDPDRLVEFYRAAVGLDVERDDDDWCVQLGVTRLLIRRGHPAGPVSMCWQVADLDAEIARLRGRGITITRTSSADAWGCCDVYGWSAGFADPDGNQYALQAVENPIDVVGFLVHRFGADARLQAFAAGHREHLANPQSAARALRATTRTATLEEALQALRDALSA